MISQRLLGSVGQWRLVLIMGVVAIAFGVVAMHQLSSGHSFALPQTQAQSGHHEQSPGSGTTQPTATQNPCTDCGDHGFMVTCLLALTLLVIGWLLRPPKWLPRPPNRRPGTPRRTPASLLIRSHTLSLVELSICRT